MNELEFLKSSCSAETKASHRSKFLRDALQYLIKTISP